MVARRTNQEALQVWKVSAFTCFPTSVSRLPYNRKPRVLEYQAAMQNPHDASFPVIVKRLGLRYGKRSTVVGKQPNAPLYPIPYPLSLLGALTTDHLRPFPFPSIHI